MNFIETNIIRINLRHSHFSHQLKISKISFHHDHGTDYRNSFRKDEFKKMIFAAALCFRDKVYAKRASDSQRTQEREREWRFDPLSYPIPDSRREREVKAVLARPLHFTHTAHLSTLRYFYQAYHTHYRQRDWPCLKAVLVWEVSVGYLVMSHKNCMKSIIGILAPRSHLNAAGGVHTDRFKETRYRYVWIWPN